MCGTEFDQKRRGRFLQRAGGGEEVEGKETRAHVSSSTAEDMGVSDEGDGDSDVQEMGQKFRKLAQDAAELTMQASSLASASHLASSTFHSSPPPRGSQTHSSSVLTLNSAR